MTEVPARPGRGGADVTPGGVDDTILDMSPGYRRVYRGVRLALVGVGRAMFRVEVVGAEHVPSEGGFIAAPGAHRSILDTPMVAMTGSRVLRYMGAESYFETPGLGSFLRAMGGFPVERSATDRAAMRLAEAVLARGEPLVVFPEGTRQSGAIVQELKQGAAFLACRQQVPIVPIGLGGAERAMPRGARVPRPRKLVVVVGEPILPPPREQGRVKRASITALSETLREALQNVFDEAQIRAAG